MLGRAVLAHGGRLAKRRRYVLCQQFESDVSAVAIHCRHHHLPRPGRRCQQYQQETVGFVAPTRPDTNAISLSSSSSYGLHDFTTFTCSRSSTSSTLRKSQPSSSSSSSSILLNTTKSNDCLLRQKPLLQQQQIGNARAMLQDRSEFGAHRLLHTTAAIVSTSNVSCTTKNCTTARRNNSSCSSSSISSSQTSTTSSESCDQPLVLPRKNRCDIVPLGQPTSETHPHLVRPGHCVSGFTADELASRRQKLFDVLCEIVPSAQRHLVVIPSASKVHMTEKIPYAFRQNSNFYYLCGFMEPDSVLVISGERGTRPRSTLFVPKHDPLNELWDGPRTGPAGAKRLLEVDEAFSTSEVEHFILQHGKAMQWSQRTNYKAFDHLLKGSEPIGPAIDRLRLIKSRAEVELMQQAANITCESFVETIRASHPFVLESQLAAKFDFESRIRGSQRGAYPPVIAGGDRANIIHYIASNQVVMGDELVLMDAGAEMHLYASDVTRTWPVTGRYTQPQRELYQQLQETHEKLVAMLHEFDRYSLDDLFEQMCVLIARGLQQLSIADARVSSEAELRRIGYEFCPHHVSHYLGMDVHDTPSVSRKTKLQPGMVITIEPGIYIPRSRADVPFRYRGIGLRIEDDVLITEDGPQVLSRKCPRTIDQIEALFA